MKTFLAFIGVISIAWFILSIGFAAGVVTTAHHKAPQLAHDYY